MRKHLVTLLLLFTFCGGAQTTLQPYATMPSVVKENLKPQQLTRYLDSLQTEYETPLVAKFNQIDIDRNSANIIQRDHAEILNWKFETQDFGTRIYFSTLILGDDDTISFISPKNELLETITRKDLIGTKFTTKPSIDGLLIRLAHNSGRARISISGYSIEPLNKDKTKIYGFGDSDPCQVNSSCLEGGDYSDVRRSVVRILIKTGSAFSWCTGSLVNNTRYDFQPYIITAEHCALNGGSIASESDLDSWTFYFNYESDDCDNPDSEGDLDRQRITGAELVANSGDNGGDNGSDFLLLRLKTAIPSRYNVFYAGWNNSELDVPKRGVSVHHPSGDIRKISTYLNPARSGAFGNNARDTHWVVKWAQTVSGHGTTEAGSSGSPLYDENKLLCGILTGGASRCAYPEDPDFYGKFSYSWRNNGSAENRRLAPWLDPDNLGFKALKGAFNGETPPSLGDELKIYPIPTNDDFLTIENIGLPQDDIAMHLYDSNGKMLLSEDAVSIPGQSIQLNVSRLNNGLYVLIIERNQERLEKKIMVMR